MDSRMLFAALMCTCLFTNVSPQALLCNFDNAVHNTATLPCTCDSVPCELTQLTSDNYNWLAWKGTTPSSGTGPSDDHTLHNGQGLFIYAEASDISPQHAAVIETSSLSLGTTSCLRFWYHMSGQHMGTLTVTGLTSSGAGTILWEMIGDQEDNWLQAVVSVPSNIDKLTMKATRGGSAIGMPYGDIGLDDIRVDRQLCPGVTTTAGSTTSTTTTTTASTSTAATTTTTQTPPTSTNQQELWGLDETLWIIILCVAGAVILVLLVIVCVQACAMRRMRTARIVRQSDDYSNIEAYNKDHPPQSQGQRDNYINAYDNMAMEADDKPTAHPNGGGLI